MDIITALNINKMKNNTALFCFLTVIITSSTVQCVSVLGPKALRPFGNYKVSIAGGSRAHNLYVAVEGKRATGEQFSQGRLVQVPPAASRLIDLEIGDPGPGKYRLVARSTSGPLFAASASLVYQPRSFCIFIQTDKRVYQPGDTINFRVIALDKYLLPLSSTVDVSLLDTGGSPVRQWAAKPLDRGIFAEELLLADEPALGQWTIQVEVRGQKYSRQILVADYVLPKFHMDVQMPKEMLFSDGRFNINVTAKHFNGLPVKGELTISAYAVFFSGLLQPVFSTPARKVIDFNGQADLVYDLKTDLDLAEDAARPLVVEAVLEEKDTLIRQNITTRILLLRTPYRLKVTAPDRFKPTLPYIVQIELVNSSGQTMKISDEVIVERLWDDGFPVNKTTIALTKGFAKYTFTPDLAHANSTLNLVIKYKEISERVVNVQKSLENGGQFLVMELLTRNTSVGDELRARITATEPMDLVHYVIIGRGDILVAKTLELSPARRSVDVSERVSAGMAPGCTLLAWYPRLAADAVRSARAASLHAAHVHRTPPHALARLSPHEYPDYAHVYKMMLDGPSGDHPYYTPYPDHMIVEITTIPEQESSPKFYEDEDDELLALKRVKLLNLVTNETVELTVSLIAVLIGSKPDLFFLQTNFSLNSMVPQEDECIKCIEKKDNENQRQCFLRNHWHYIKSVFGQSIRICKSRYLNYSEINGNTDTKCAVPDCNPDLKCACNRLDIEKAVKCQCEIIPYSDSVKRKVVCQCHLTNPFSDGLGFGVDPSKPVDGRGNPIAIDKSTHEVLNAPKGLYALGPLTADNFIRFIPGGAVAIVAHLHKEMKQITE